MIISHQEKLLSQCLSPEGGNATASYVSETISAQRYLFFRSWYAGKRVVDLSRDCGFGTHYASVFAKESTGLRLIQKEAEEAQKRYSLCHFQSVNPLEFDFSAYDLILCFGLLDHHPAPEKLLESFSRCQGSVLLSIQKLTNPQEDEDSFQAFKELVKGHFPGKKITFLYQEKRWPGLLHLDPVGEIGHYIVVIGSEALPFWPRIGISIPTHNGAKDLEQAFLSLSGGYPGQTYFAVSSNGCNRANLDCLDSLESSFSYMLKILVSKENLGYGIGSNRGFKYLVENEKIDYYAVSNDDVIAGIDFLSLQIEAIRELERQGYHPGVVAPVSNRVSGAQQVDVGSFSTLEEMQICSEFWHKNHHEAIFINPQLRGLFLLIHPECLKTIGGFDPLFGLGNFEDDDFNVRTILAGFTNWIVQGAFLYHKGSQTFQRMEVDYGKSIRQNSRRFKRKWRVEEMERAFDLKDKPENIELFVPFNAAILPEGPKVLLGDENIDLIHEASDIEFAGWVMYQLKQNPCFSREKVIEQLLVS